MSKNLKHIVNFSGGKDSTAMLLRMLEENMQVDKNIKIDYEKDLSEQNVDSQTLSFLNNIIQKVRMNELSKEYEKDIKDYIAEVNSKNAGFEAQVDNVNLREDIEKLEIQNQKIPKAKELIQEYQQNKKKKEEEIVKLKEECNALTSMLNKIPKFIRKIFLRNHKVKLLQEKND